MLKLFVNVILVGSLILNLVNINSSTTEIDAGSSWNYELKNDSSSTDHSIKKNNYPDDKNPELTCLIFGNQACHTKCYLIAQIYGKGAYGTCDKNLFCVCSIQGISSFFDQWEKNFDSDFVREKIINGLLFHQADIIMAHPLKTAEQYKQLLKPIISPYQFTKLQTRDDTFASKFTRNGRVNAPAIKKYVYDTLQKTWASLDRPYLHVDYKKTLLDALKEASDDQGSFYNLVYKIHQMNNTTLEKILDEFLQKNDIRKPSIELDKVENLDDIIHQSIMYEIIEQNDKNRTNQISSADTVDSPKATANSSTAINRNFPYPGITSFGNNRWNRNHSTASAGNPTEISGNPTPRWIPPTGYGSRFNSSRFFPPGRRSKTGI